MCSRHSPPCFTKGPLVSRTLLGTQLTCMQSADGNGSNNAAGNGAFEAHTLELITLCALGRVDDQSL